MTQAEEIMRRYNRNALIGTDDDDAICMIEDWADPDGRIYRMEYRSTPDGQHAVGFCRYTPWGATPNAGEAYVKGHVAEDGFLCLGGAHPGHDYGNSPYALDFVIPRARFWCTAFSVLKESGEFPGV